MRGVLQKEEAEAGEKAEEEEEEEERDESVAPPVRPSPLCSASPSTNDLRIGMLRLRALSLLLPLAYTAWCHRLQK